MLSSPLTAARVAVVEVRLLKRVRLYYNKGQAIWRLIVKLRRLFTETMMTIDKKTANSLTFSSNFCHIREKGFNNTKIMY